MKILKSALAEIEMTNQKLKDFGLLWGIALPLFATAGWLLRSYINPEWHFATVAGVLVLIITLNLLPLIVRIFSAFLLPLLLLYFGMNHEGINVVFPAIGLILTLIGMIQPFFLKYPYLAWMLLALGLGFIVSRIILAILFYLVITPISVLTRMFGKRYLETRFITDEPTYWVKPDRKSKKDKTHYEKQF